MSVAILYGSQTGTAQDIAERMTRQALQLDLKVELHSMDEYDLEKLKEEKFIVFIAATTGQGEEPDNMKRFWKYLCRKNCKPIFAGIKYCVLGLGDSSYAKYNFVGKRLQKRVSQLGGISLVHAWADDQHDLGVDAVAPEWIRGVWKSILGDKYKAVTGVGAPKFKICQVSTNVTTNGFGNMDISNNTVNSTTKLESSLVPASDHEMRFNKILKSRRVTSPDHFQDVRFIEIDSANLYYKPGDVLNVQPENLKENIDLFFQLFPMLNPSQEIHLEPQYSWVKISPQLLQLIQPSTWSNIVKYYLDIQSVPRKSFFEYLASFADDEMEKWKLTEFCTPEGQDDLYQYCFKPKRNILEVLMDFPKTTEKIPLEYIFDLIPPIKFRSFSIANYSEETVGVLVAVVEFQTKLKKPRLGLCSNWLARLNPGDVIPCWITKGSFIFPDKNQEIPLIMIGPGTGCAPFNSLISERIPSKSPNELYLFFGCRYSQKDYFFEQEWTLWNESGSLKLFVAFSRDENSRLKYVQHQMEENDELVYDLIVNKNAMIFVAGNAKRMPLDVQTTIETILKQRGITDSESYVKTLVRQGRYQTEVWS